jgi:tRNA threonylcarbamoyladenosine biosynthesis protein TsaE
VPSPTYTLVEPYNCDGRAIYHLDLYRLQNAAELEYLGIDELALPGAVLLIEWPGQGGQHLVPPDLEIFLEISGAGRACRMLPRSLAGAGVLAALMA